MRTGSAVEFAEAIEAQLGELPILTTEPIRSVRRRYSRALANSSPDLVIQTALHLMGRKSFACRLVAHELVSLHKPAFASITVEQLLKLGEGMDSWGAVDCYARLVSGPAWRDGRLSSETIRQWTQSPDRWWRRAALVSTVALSRRRTTRDAKDAVEICELIVADTDDMVLKALSWALREVARQNAGEARAFLDRHQGSLGATVVREVANTIRTGRKEPRRRPLN